jgi:hypothetical protein
MARRRFQVRGPAFPAKAGSGLLLGEGSHELRSEPPFKILGGGVVGFPGTAAVLATVGSLTDPTNTFVPEPFTVRLFC